MKTINLATTDTKFIRDVEGESGQTVANCYQCGNCTAGCPMSFTYDLSVSQVMRLIQIGQKDMVLRSRAIWMCATCDTCTQRCPNNIDVARIMDVCRHMSRREKLGSVYAVKTFWDSFITSVGLNGRVHELGLMAMYVLRTGRFLTDMDLAPKVLPKGKMSIMPHQIQGKKEVADIIKRFKQGCADKHKIEAELLAKAKTTECSGRNCSSASCLSEQNGGAQ